MGLFYEWDKADTSTFNRNFFSNRWDLLNNSSKVLIMNESEKKDTIDLLKKVPVASSILASIEVVLGGIIHSLHLPLGGHFLSLNQILLLSMSTSGKERMRAVTDVNKISLLAGAVKVFSPIGKTLTPMLALFAQGSLLSFGILFFGNNLLGLCIGGVLASLWAFIQPLLLAAIFFGTEFLERSLQWMEKTLSFFQVDKDWIFISFWSLVVIKVILTLFLIIFFIGIGTKYDSYSLRYFKFIKKISVKENASSFLFEDMNSELSEKKVSFKEVLKDLLNPFFLFSLIFSIFLFILSSKKDFNEVFQFILRPLLSGFLFFWLMREPIVRIKLNRFFKSLLKKS